MSRDFLSMPGLDRVRAGLKDAAAKIGRTATRWCTWDGRKHVLALAAFYDHDVNQFSILGDETEAAPGKVYAAYARFAFSVCVNLAAKLELSDNPRDWQDARLIREIDAGLALLLRETAPERLDDDASNKLPLANSDRRKMH